MFITSWRGGWSSGAIGIAALIALALLCGPALSHATGSDAKAAKKCTKAVVDGRNACLRKGDKCKKRFQDDYVRAGLSCKKARLRKASIKQLRGSEPLLVSKNGQLSTETALAAFNTAVAALPGVKPKPGEIGAVREASSVVNTLEASAAKLSPAQRKVLAAATTPAPDALVVPVDDAAAARPEPPAVASVRPAARGNNDGGVTVTNGTFEEQLEAVRSLRSAVTIMRAHGFVFHRPISVSFLTTTEIIKGEPAYAYVSSSDLPPGTSPNCNMFVTKDGREASAAVRQLVYAHELAHCAQHEFASTRSAFNAMPDWVIEGGADWLGGMVVQQTGGPVEAVDWEPWLGEPTDDLFTREYSGVGFFAMIHQAGIDGWGRMREVLAVASAGSAAAYERAIAGVPDAFWNRWGPGLLRDKSLGAEWDYEGPGIDPSAPDQISLGNGGRKARTIKPRSSDGGRISLKTDILIIKADKGLRGRLQTLGATRPLAKGAYCAKSGGCKCSTNTPLQLPKVGSALAFGFNDGFKARTVTFEGRKLKDYCKHPSPGPGADGPSGPGGGGSCPTTPTARPALRRECPAPAPGIGVFMGEDAVQVANFTIGSCTVGPGGFTAIAVDGAWRLEVGISNFTGFGTYTVPYGGPDPQVVIEGPAGTFSNETWQPGGLTFSGAIDFNNGDKHALGVGWIEYRDAAGSEATAIRGAGGMSCVYPDDEP